MTKESSIVQHKGPDFETKWLIPERLRRYVPELWVTQAGPLSFVSHPFAEPVTNEALLSRVPVQEQPQAKLAIEATGVSTRYFRPLQEKTTSLQIADEAASASALLLNKLLAAKAWDSVDHVVFSSAVLSDEVSKSTLARNGMTPNKVNTQSYHLFCAGTAAAFIDVLANPTLADKRVVIIASEPLSSLYNPSHFSAENIAIPAIFGEDYAAIAFVPGDFTLVAAKTAIIPDRGVIKVQTDYTAGHHDPAYLPSHYTLFPHALDFFAATPRGITMKTDTPQTGKATMDGLQTGIFFKNYTPPVIAQVLHEAQAKGIVPKQAIVHQPSGPVLRGIAKVLGREKTITPPPIDFLLPHMHRSNSSSATTLVTWEYMAKTGKFDPSQPFLLAAPGIGAAITAAVIVPRG